MCAGSRSSFYNERTEQSLPVLHDIDLQVRTGELVSVVGPSGCGKSTLLNAVDGLIKVTAGDILVDGRTVAGPGPDRAHGCSSTTACFPWRTVVDERDVRPRPAGPARQGGAPRGGARSNWWSWSALAGFAEHYPHELSGGMRQRVNIARAPW